MYFHESSAQQIMRTNDQSSSPYVAAAQQPVRRLLRTLWIGVRQVAWGIDAFSSVMHGIDVPPEHGARNGPTSSPGHPRP